MGKSNIVSRYSLLLVPAGLLINILGVRLALCLELPLFLDSIGTVLAAALGGYLPGMMVGFLSNIINGISDPITLYYGILSILIAAVSAAVSRAGWFKSIGKTLLTALLFALIGGGLGSVLTWMLYGFSFGSGISAPFALALHESAGLSEFSAQFTADMGIDLADKLITAFAAFVVLRILPDKFLNKLNIGGLYNRNGEAPEAERSFFRKKSLRSKVVLITVISTSVLSVLATAISFLIYMDTATKKNIDTADSVANLMVREIDADRINEYLETGVEDAAYFETETELAEIRDSVDEITYMYVYRILEDGCHVVFDIDTPELPGEELCAVIPFDEEFLEYRDELLAGLPIDPIISNGQYGWLLTAYTPLYDSSGACAAYAAADIAMDDVMTDRYVFIIKMVSLLFGISIIIITGTVWFAERGLVAPINAMTVAADRFAYDSEAERLIATERLQNVSINTGDEIESLYQALSKTARDVAQYIGDINEKTALIVQMQNNTIMSFAAMVESRDKNTGKHIKHTAGYVNLIANELRRSEKYADRLTDEYVESITRSAPLHDIGKIEISDVILNKPGKLTDEEFAIMKTHTTAGRRILESIVEHISDTTYLSEALDMAAYHHERWDGKGYPEGLSGEDIPLSARIMAVADVFDALISKRSYKEPFDMTDAISIITEESGTHFDPDVVAAFLARPDEIERLS